MGTEEQVSKAAKALSVLGASKGGKARAKSLTEEQRKEQAAKAAEARWAKTRLPAATHGSPDKPLKIGDAEIQCYVLNGNVAEKDKAIRVLTQADFQVALGKHRKANVRREDVEEQLPAILQGKSINRFIDNDLKEKSRPIKFRLTTGAIRSEERRVGKEC